jgi:hypothetical protein
MEAPRATAERLRRDIILFSFLTYLEKPKTIGAGSELFLTAVSTFYFKAQKSWEFTVLGKWVV